MHTAVIQHNGKPVVRLVPVVEEPRSLASVRGVWRGRVHIADDFDELPEDIARPSAPGEAALPGAPPLGSLRVPRP